MHASARRKDRRRVADGAAAAAVAVGRLQMMVRVQLLLKRMLKRGGHHPSANPRRRIMNHRDPALLLGPNQRPVRRTLKLLLLLPNQRLRNFKPRVEAASRVALAKSHQPNLLIRNLRNPM